MLAIIYRESDDKVVMTELTETMNKHELLLPDGPSEYQAQTWQHMASLPFNAGVIVSVELDEAGAISDCINLKSFMVPSGTVASKADDAGFINMLTGVAQNLLQMEMAQPRVLH